MAMHITGTRKGWLAARFGMADWLGLAATPTFALMALVTVVSADGSAGMLCGSAHHTSPLDDMTMMYLLMSAFHTGPWFRLAARLGR
jgi:hypothetical protein